MIRRLHVEDAHTSAIAITNAKEGRGVRDDQSFEDLASEFKNLLSKISTEYGGLPDQSVALGLALAQSATPQVHERPEAAPQSTKDDTVEDDRGGADPEFQFLSEDDSTQGDIEESVVDRKIVDGDGGKHAARDIAVRRVFEGQDADSVEVETSDDSLHALSDAVEPEEQKLSSILVADVKPEAKDAESVSVAPAQHSDSSVMIETVDDAQAVKLHDFTAKTLIKSEVDAEAQEDEILVDDLSMVAGPEDTIPRELRLAAQKASQELVRAHDKVNQAREVSTTPNLREQAFSGDQDSNLLRDNELGEVEQMVNSTTKRSVRIGDEALTGTGPDLESLTHFSSSEQFAARPIQTSDATIQMALLRQAFERLQSLGSLDNKASKVSGVGEGIVPPQVTSSTTRSESREEAPSAARARPQSHMARMLERVDATLKEVARSKDGKSITLKLDPVDLGKVRIDVTLRDGKLHAKITPDNQDVMQSLRENAHDLQGSLRKLGLEVDSVSVSIGFERFEEGESTQQFASGRSFQDEGHNLPFEDGQVPENIFGNKFAVDTPAGSSEVNQSPEVDHWIA